MQVRLEQVVLQEISVTQDNLEVSAQLDPQDQPGKLEILELKAHKEVQDLVEILVHPETQASQAVLDPQGIEVPLVQLEVMELLDLWDQADQLEIEELQVCRVTKVQLEQQEIQVVKDFLEQSVHRVIEEHRAHKGL